MTEKKSIAFCFDKNYAIYCQVALISLLLNSGAHYQIYCLYSEDVDPDDLNSILILTKRFNADIELMKIDLEIFEKFKIYGYYTYANYMRLLLPELLPNVDKILYLDCDIIVADNSISELFDLDISNHKYIGVLDRNADTDHLGPEIKGKYINSGVLMMNLKMLRADESFAKIKLLHEQNINRIIWVDQCLINLYGHNSIMLIENKFNYQIYSHECSKEDWDNLSEKAIYHFCNHIKPWHKCSRIHVAEFWWRYATLVKNNKIIKIDSNLIDNLIFETKSLEEYEKYEESCVIKDRIISGLLSHIQQKQNQL